MITVPKIISKIFQSMTWARSPNGSTPTAKNMAAVVQAIQGRHFAGRNIIRAYIMTKSMIAIVFNM